MRRAGAPQADINYLMLTKDSMARDDVAVHRDLINRYNWNDPWREVNNFALHPVNYRYGQTGASSPAELARMLEIHRRETGEPILISGPARYKSIDPLLRPHVQFPDQ